MTENELKTAIMLAAVFVCDETNSFLMFPSTLCHVVLCFCVTRDCWHCNDDDSVLLMLKSPEETAEPLRNRIGKKAFAGLFFRTLKSSL